MKSVFVTIGTMWHSRCTPPLTISILLFLKFEYLLQLNSNKLDDSIQKREQELNRHFSKDNIKMVNGYMKRCSASLIIVGCKFPTC